MDKHTRFQNACRFEPVDRPPLWIMRQAGRYLPEYRAFREKHSFLEMCHTPDYAAEVTLQPLRRFNMDAGIIFSDILIIPEAMGLDVSFPGGGPKISPSPQTMDDLEKLVEPNVNESLKFIGDAIELVRKEAPDTPILGFAGAPFTLGCYMVASGSKDHHFMLKQIAYRDPEFYSALMNRLADAVIDLLKLQIASGAAAVQMFDTWAGEWQPTDYDKYVLPYHQKIFSALESEGVPRILYVKNGSAFVDRMGDSGADVLGVDWRQNLGQARKILGRKVALQGNLDPAILYAPKEIIRAEVKRIYNETGGEGHIFNLGHGIRPDAPIEGVETLIEALHELEQ